MAFREDPYYIERINKGDTAAFAQLVEKHKDWVYTIVIKVLRNPEDAEEIAQDVFLKAYKALDKFEGKSKFSTWLYSIAYNTAISKTRKKKLKTSDLEDELIESYSDAEVDMGFHEISFQEQKQRLEKALKSLHEDENVMIGLFYQNENSIEEISRIMDLSESNVKVKLHRIRKKLYAKLQQIDKIEMQKESF